MGERIRSHPWGDTVLGPIKTWPQSLQTAVGILLNSRYPMFIWWGPNLINIYNDSYIPILGTRHPEALGLSAPDIWSEIWPVVGPQMEAVVNEGRATWNEALLLVMQRFGYEEETYFTFSYSPIFNTEGTVEGLFCACSEETARVIGDRRLKTLRELATHTVGSKNAEDACARSAIALGNNPYDLPFVLIYLLVEDKKHLRLWGNTDISAGSDASPFTVETHKAEDPHSWPFERVMESGSLHLIEDILDRFGKLPGGPWPDSTRSAAMLPLAKAGEEYPTGMLIAGLSPRLVFDENYKSFLNLVANQVASAVAYARAHEEERKRAEALAELDRSKTEFFSNVSHEFRTPLTLLLGSLEETLKNNQIPEEERKQLTLANRNALRLVKLVNSLLDFSRIQAGRIQANYQSTELDVLTTDIASLFRSAVEREGIRFTIDCQHLPEKVYVDHEMWEKIILNLLSNAFKFTLEGEIELTLRTSGANAELRVRDTGTGIPAPELPRLFERFHRVRGTRARSHEGTGIGLALVKELVNLHGGSIHAESESNKGSTFVITIPFGSSHLPSEKVDTHQPSELSDNHRASYVEEAMRWLPDAPSDAIPASTSKRLRILIADDNADMREYLNRLLSVEYDIDTASNGEVALSVIQRSAPDLVLADVMMPQMDGFGLLKQLRSNPPTSTIPVILLSARAGEESKVEGLEAGADDYLVKPFSAGELRARIATHLELLRLRLAVAAALKDSEQRYRTILESITDAFYALDEEWRFTYVNNKCEQLLSRARSELIGRNIWEEYPDARESSLYDAYRTAMSDGTPASLEYFHSPGQRWYDVRAYPGKYGLAIYLHDISERKQAEAEKARLLMQERNARQEAQEANLLKDDFLATVSHELRTPLNSILGWAQMLRSGLIQGPDQDHALGIIYRNAKSQAQLIEDLLDVSRIITGKLQLRIHPMNLKSIIMMAIDSLQPAIEAKNIRLQKRLSSEPILISGDPDRVQQVVWNLLSNAVKFTPEQGKIRIQLIHTSSAAEIIVGDTGKGIDPAFLPFIFDRFRQADSSSTRKYGGLGLGLAIVRHLVDLHGGSVEAESGGENKGATFVVRLPIMAHSRAIPPTTIDRKEESRNIQVANSSELKDVQILLVDDERDTLEVLETCLMQVGAIVRISGSASDALKQMKEWKPDILISDIAMPDKDGYWLIQRIRKLGDHGKNLPAIALTAYARIEDRERVLSAGFQMYVPKPVEPSELLGVVTALVSCKT